ncbi:MAG: 3-isopropylmalate dehydrogenase [Gammaproteobacteria bacterium]|nr:MAG: 3-isopropylmalate dehydrogenase [Gammaproteobacteria bacterium]RTZ70211.1 MAG: 3-isopropylmalate dehydrogenase [Aquificaceae bacterium]
MEKVFKIAVLKGDGIGPEVVDAALEVLNTISQIYGVKFEYREGLIGGIAIDETGEPLPDETLELCLNSDAVLLGAVGGPKWDNLPQDKKPERGLLKIRKALNLYANLRPVKVFDALIDSSPLKPEVVRGTDLLVVRELVSGIYYGEPRGIYEENGKKCGKNTMKYCEDEIERVTRKAFEIARKRKKKVTSVDKANVLDVSALWREVVNRVAKDYPDVELEHLYVDNAAMQLIRRPSTFDVIVTGNIFGDILSDEAGVLPGSLGMLPSASIGDKYALYEPVHGSAPDIAGQGIANPIATILSAGMMLKYSFNMDEAGMLIEKAIEETLNQGYRTADIYSEGTIKVDTKGMTQKIVENIKRLANK